MPTDTPTVFVVDADPSIRSALETRLRRAGWKPALFVSTGDFLASETRPAPGCLILDVTESDALNDMHRIATNRREIPVIAMSEREEVSLTVRAMKAGAVEFLTKPLADDRVLEAVGQAIGQSQAILQKEADLLELCTRHDSLSPREKEVMARVVAGHLNKRIGRALGISEITVKAHRGRVMRKMRADSLADLVRMALRLRLPTVPSARTELSTSTREGHRMPAPARGGLQPIRIMPFRSTPASQTR